MCVCVNVVSVASRDTGEFLNPTCAFVYVYNRHMYTMRYTRETRHDINTCTLHTEICAHTRTWHMCMSCLTERGSEHIWRQPLAEHFMSQGCTLPHECALERSEWKWSFSMHCFPHPCVVHVHKHPSSPARLHACLWSSDLSPTHAAVCVACAQSMRVCVSTHGGYVCVVCGLVCAICWNM